ncbi:hypothetical protein GMLC_35710 [Geomonas limicola]|uniref:Phosphate ABC transporter substrate-binding protein n=1 Tax=Geomonas limicola TaxID=2740186 RepID=A0A6V8NBJ1_9BACT|nr:phosphate/phosphite/phosphonate ABC transporter substrate-binding protein [Geomonas limicola]GFO69992.1 hypothetical protein GMLC_35710 [Geomonas limicola]
MAGLPRWKGWLAAVAALFTLGIPTAPGAQEPFVVGVAPHTSARVIVQMYQPLRRYLESALRQPVEIVTATDFTEFARAGMKQSYDLAITTAHQARLLEKDAHYLPLFTYRAEFRAVVIVAAQGPIRSPADLEGRGVLGLSATSLVTLWGEKWLRDRRLSSVPVRYVSASDSVAHLVLAGEAAAGFTSRSNFDMLAPAVRSQLRVLASSPPIPGRVYLLGARQAPRQAAIDEALWSFAASPEGRRYFETHKLGGYRRLRPGELPSMEHFADEVRRELKKARP